MKRLPPVLKTQWLGALALMVALSGVASGIDRRLRQTGRLEPGRPCHDHTEQRFRPGAEAPGRDRTATVDGEVRERGERRASWCLHQRRRPQRALGGDFVNPAPVRIGCSETEQATVEAGDSFVVSTTYRADNGKPHVYLVFLQVTFDPTRLSR